MRPRYLEIEGLQSFKELQTVDFDKLGETGLFGIFGPTGSGKSTILDAITLALYGNVQRASHGTQGIANTGLNTVKVAFVFDLLKSGVRRTFRVERSYKRKKSSDNSVEVKVARLIEVNGDKSIIMSDKPSEVNQNIIELLGLKDDDFTRSVVLPQNKFQEFLLMDKSKKRDMMERIFYLEDYGRNLTEKVAKKLSAVKFKLSGIEGAISAFGEMNEKSLIETESAMLKAFDNRKAIDANLKITEIQLNEAKEIWDIVSDINALLNREEKLLSNKNFIDEKINELGLGQKAADISKIIEKYSEDENNLKATKKLLSEVNEKLPAALKDLEKAKAEHEISVNEAEKQSPVLIERRSKLSEAINSVSEMKALTNQLNELREEYMKLKSVLDQKIKDINLVKRKAEGAENLISDIRQQMENIKDDLNYRQQVQKCLKSEEDIKVYKKDRETKAIREKELFSKIQNGENELSRIKELRHNQENEFTLLKEKIISLNDSCPGSRDSISGEGELYHELKATCETLKLIKRDVDVFIGKNNVLNSKIDELKKEIANEEEKKKKVIENSLSIKESIHELMNKKELSAASILSKSLIDGMPCPVCGSYEHPKPAFAMMDECTEDLDIKINETQENLQKIEIQIREAESICIKLAEQLRSSEHEYERNNVELIQREKEYLEVSIRLPDEIKQKNLDELFLHIERLNQNRTIKLQDLEAWEKSKADLEEQKLKTNDLVNKFKTEEASRYAELEVNKENIKLIQSDLQLADSMIKDITTQYTSLIISLRIESAEKEMLRLDSNMRKAELLQKQAEEAEKQLKDLRNTFENLENERQKLADELYDVRTRGEVLRVKKEEGDKKLLELTAGKDIAIELTEIEEKLSGLEKSENEKLLIAKELEKKYNSYESDKQMLDNQNEIYTRVFQTEAQRLSKSLEEKGFANIVEAKKHILSEADMVKLKSEIDEFKDAVKSLQTHKQLLEHKLNGRTITEEQWLKIQNDHTILKSQKDESISTYENAKSSYLSYKKNFEQWLELDRDRQKFLRKKEMLEQLQKLLKGNSFIEFISEERLRYIAKEASDTLGILTKFRYSIELDADNGFVIRDNSNGGVNRLVTSLSGGETFLTSLALSLALSSQIQLKGQSPLEFFFLDEGFGTLDKELLNTVIDSLERISSTKKVIGLISHVPELRERITRRLIVEPATVDGYGSSVRLEKA